MKKINIYLVANEKEVEQDRIELEKFIENLNNRNNSDYKICFELINDNFDELDEEKIKNSELFYILFCNEMSMQNIDKFNIAYNNFIENLTPKITIYKKNSDKQVGEGVNEFLKRIDKDLGLYHSIYDNVDTIKLNLILRLKNLESKLGDLITYDGTLYIDAEDIMSVKNIPMILNNGNLKNLKEEEHELLEKYRNKRKKYRKNQTEENLAECRKVSERREKVQDKIFELEENIINLENFFVEISSKGRLAQRQIYAKKYLDLGKIEDAKKVLDFEKIKKDAEENLKFKGSKKEALRININELIQRVDILKIDVTNKKRFEEIEKIFEDAIEIEKEGELYRETLIEYVSYLNNQNKFKKSIRYAEIFLKYANLFKISESDFGVLRVYNLLGMNYSKMKQYKKAEEYFEKEVNLLSKDLTIQNVDFLISIYASLSRMYSQKQDRNLAEFYWIKSDALKEEMVNNYPQFGQEAVESCKMIISLCYNSSEQYIIPDE